MKNLRLFFLFLFFIVVNICDLEAAGTAYAKNKKSTAKNNKKITRNINNEKVNKNTKSKKIDKNIENNEQIQSDDKKTKISSIKVVGNERIDKSIVLNYALFNEGMEYNSQNANDSIKNLYETGLFKEVYINYNDTIGELIITVNENPLITEIGFDGNDKIDDNVLSSEILSTKRSVFSKNKINSDVKRILDLYRRTGRFLATVEPKIIEEDNNRVKVVFEIKEGKPAKIRKIHIIGANAFSERDLKAEMRSKESKLLRFSSSEIYDPARLEFDNELLRRFYFSKGYPDFEVLSSIGEIDRDNKWFDITILIEEGEKYKFNNISITNNIKKVSTKKLQKGIKIKKGKIFNNDLINLSIDNITNELAKEGFVFVNIHPIISKDTENRTVDVDFVIDESPRIYVGEIKIIGNTRTHDDVIRREMKLEEGDPFSLSKFDRSIQRIRNLGFFETVNAQKIKGKQPNQMDIIIEVQEKKTGELQFGIGYSTVDGANVNIGIKESNLLGTGQDINFNIMYAKYSKDISISYGKPYFLGRDLYTGFGLFYRKNEDEYSVNYKETNYGGNLNVSYLVTEYLRQRLFYTIYEQEITDVSYNYYGIISDGETLTSSIGQSLYYDRKDSRFNPTKGFAASWTLEYAGVGGDKHYLKNTATANIYIPVWPSIIILRLGGRAGVIEGLGEPVDPVDAFYLGGNSFKGFKYGGIGPRTRNIYTGSPKDGSAIGGTRYYVGDAELRFPLGLPKEYEIYGGLFINAGTLTGVDESPTVNKNRLVDSNSIRSAYGFSIQWMSPMGPISFDFAKVLKKEYYDESQNFNFSFGTTF